MFLEREKELQFACSVLTREAMALQQMASSLDASFCKAIDCLYETRGRIAVTGMGKSGHVARKIAATLSSTGSPAYFIHPAEASHGDLGMLTTRDRLLAFSNSGNTAELTDLILYSSRHNIPLIGVTRNADSLLGRQSTFCLLLPLVPEADPLDCAPTTSTTLQIALGDAIALTLMTRRGCTPEEFHRYHPGGSLGRKLQTVREIMHTGESLPLAQATDVMTDVLMMMTSKGFGVAGVCKDGKLIGIITDGDLRRHMGAALLEYTAADVMHSAPITIPENSLVTSAVQVMETNKVTSLFIVKDDAPLGIINIHDCLRAGVE